MREPWNRCDVCGKLIAMDDFDKGATRRMLTPDSDRSREEWETLCIAHSPPQKASGNDQADAH